MIRDKNMRYMDFQLIYIFLLHYICELVWEIPLKMSFNCFILVYKNRFYIKNRLLKVKYINIIEINLIMHT